MKVVVYIQYGLFVDYLELFIDVDVLKFEVGLQDLLVKVDVIVVNLVDMKVCMGLFIGQLCIFGWDVVGIVEVVGSVVLMFVFGDKVFFVGLIVWFGVYVQYVVVDECIVGCKFVMLFDV